MKSILLLSFFLLVSNAMLAQQVKSKIEVLDFHSTHRCMTCNAIEKNTRAVLAKYFKDEVSQGKISFRLVNIDEKENEAVAKEFQAYGTSLFLRLNSNGETSVVNLTEFAFMNVNKSDHSFEEGLTKEIKKLLEKI